VKVMPLSSLVDLRHISLSLQVIIHMTALSSVTYNGHQQFFCFVRDDGARVIVHNIVHDFSTVLSAPPYSSCIHTSLG